MKLLRDPLVHFLLIGAALFLVDAWQGGPSAAPGGGARAARGPDAQIVVRRQDIDRATSQFERTWQRPPTEEEAKGLVEDLIRSEIYCREAIALGLDRDDEVLRRRLRMKMEFILEDVTAWPEPTDAELRVFVDAHRDAYVTEPQVAFRQVLVRTDTRGADAESAARDVLAQLTQGADPGAVGDPTQLEAVVPLATLSDIRTRFGDAFARSLLDLSPGGWAGPVRSGFGLHLVRVDERRDGRLPELSEIRETAKRDWTARKQRDVKDAAYAKLRERYTVTVEKPGTGDAPAAAGGSGAPR